ncbi:glycoside hydrolase family 25 protein [Tenuifilum thalassicum]|uniref:Glycoside hydrolase family 25 n=1 Tax=Tenuifilum thalassicum TaxID=2590900 RepID=A0A7D4AVT3_9BACT|nr:GH25 family lysozyme [Tenuifilum thalassicum]QKG78814.1 glycoside hydrolase family 25 [Tenuifilum thalassicum]
MGKKRRKKRKVSKNKYYLAAALISLLVIIILVVRFLTDPYHRYLIWGIDVSAHTGTIDWEKVKEQRVNFAFIKATEGATLRDETFRKNIAQAQNVGIPVGAYHFFNFNRSGKLQAQNYLSAIAGLNLELPPVIDVEEWGNVIRRPKKEIIKDIRAFIRLVEEKTKTKVLIYTNKDTYKWYIKDEFLENDIWICSFDHTPKIEKPWTFWQYHHEGRLDGVEGKVDYNVFYGNSIEWKHYLINKKR